MDVKKCYYEQASTLFFGDDLVEWWLPIEPLGPLSKAQFADVPLPDELLEVDVADSR